MTKLWVTGRADGRSNDQVLLNLFDKAEPGRTYTYEEIAAALNVGMTRAHTVREVQSACAKARKVILEQQGRAIISVRKVGYRIAYSIEHSPIALDKKRRADRQLDKGLLTAKYVHRNELSQEERLTLDGTVIVLSSVRENSAAEERRKLGPLASIRKLFETRLIEAPEEHA